MRIFVIASDDVALTRRLAAQEAAADVRGHHTFVTVPSFEAAIVRATDVRDGIPSVMIACRLSDLLPPDPSLAPDEWRAACLVHLGSIAVPLLRLPDPKRPADRLKVEEMIASLQKATQVLNERLKAERFQIHMRARADKQGYVCGRPPYGYEIHEGSFRVNKSQAKAVKYLFEMARKERSNSVLLALMTKRFPSEFWDRVKLRRIIGHARLYCCGEYKSPTNSKYIHLPGLAFLPVAWWNTLLPSTRPVRKEAP